MSFTVQKSFHFYAAHRNAGVSEDNKCFGLHGHTYHVDLVFGTFSEADLDDAGMTIDFGAIDAEVIKPLHDELDHSTLLSIEDFDRIAGQVEFIRKMVVMPTETSVEHLCVWIYERIMKLNARYGALVTKIKIRETESSEIEFTPDDEF